MYINIGNENVINEIKRKLFPRWKSRIYSIRIDVIEQIDVDTYASSSILTVRAIKPNKQLFSKQYIIDIESLSILSTRTYIYLSRKGKKYKIVTINP